MTDSLYRYRAFISYSHRDEKFCAWLHKALENYRIDKRLAWLETPVGRVPVDLRMIFRDRDEFSSGSLDAQTLDALKASRFLIVVASPHAAQSHYVNEEIRQFKALGGAGRVLAIVAGGDAPACFPPALRFRLDETGAVSETPDDVIAADALKDGRDRALVKIVAGLTGLPFDDLWMREVKAAKTRAIMGAAAIVAVAVLAVATAFLGSEHFGTTTRVDQQDTKNVEQDDRIKKLTAAVLAMSKARAAPGQEKEVQAAVAGIVEGARAGDARLQEAENLLAAGRIDEATALLQAEAREKETESQEKAKEAAAAYRRLGAIAGVHDPKAAREAYARAVALDPSDPDGLLWDGQFQLYAANFSAAEKSDLALLALDGKGADGNQLFWARVGLGDIAKARGDLNGALVRYREAESAMQKLAASSPANADWRRDLSASYDRVGNVFASQGKLPEALESYQAGLSIAERLSKADPANTKLQRDLSISYQKVGEVFVAQGNLPEALKAYHSDVSIAERLLKTEPSSMEWQRDLSISYDGVGDVFVKQGNLPEALKYYQAGLSIREQLHKSDPGNTEWLRDLSVSNSKLGDVSVKQGKLPEAMNFYSADLSIVERLLKTDPGNTDWLRDHSVSYGRLGNVYLKMKDFAQAREALQKGHSIMAGLVAKHPDWAQWKQDLGWFEETLAALGAEPAGGGGKPVGGRGRRGERK